MNIFKSKVSCSSVFYCQFPDGYQMNYINYTIFMVNNNVKVSSATKCVSADIYKDIDIITRNVLANRYFVKIYSA